MKSTVHPALTQLSYLSTDLCAYLQSKKEIAKGLRVLTKAENFPILVHCVHGKDRTGLFIMLVMLLCGIDPQVLFMPSLHPLLVLTIYGG